MMKMSWVMSSASAARPLKCRARPRTLSPCRRMSKVKAPESSWAIRERSSSSESLASPGASTMRHPKTIVTGASRLAQSYFLAGR
jgi:hypothetical protein